MEFHIPTQTLINTLLHYNFRQPQNCLNEQLQIIKGSIISYRLIYTLNDRIDMTCMSALQHSMIMNGIVNKTVNLRILAKGDTLNLSELRQHDI